MLEEEETEGEGQKTREVFFLKGNNLHVEEECHRACLKALFITFL